MKGKYSKLILWYVWLFYRFFLNITATYLITGKNVENCNNINVENCDDIQITENLNVVAIDPGVRTGWSWYSPSKGCGWFGNLDINHIIRLSLSLDDLISRYIIFLYIYYFFIRYLVIYIL